MKHQKLQRRIAAKGGSYALAVTAVVLAILIAVNILASVLPTALTKLDISATKLYSITSSTKVVVNNLEKDVTIYWVVQSEKEDEVIENLLGKYESLSSHITVTKKNPDVYPTFTAQYTDEDVPNNSLIVECGEKSRYISYNDIYLTDVDYTTYSYVYSFDGEGAITSAIDYVISDELPKVYTLEGHGEAELPTEFETQIEKENMELESFSLLNTDEIPEDADALLIYAPESDISAEEATLLEDYLENGGKLLVIAGPTENGTLMNLYSVLETYGVEAADGLVVEADREHYAFQQPYTLEDETYTFTYNPPADEDDEDAEGTWTYQNAEFDVYDLRTALRSLTAVSFTDETPTGQEEISLTVHLDNEDFPTFTLTLYRYDGENCIAAVDGEPVALVSRAQTVDLVEAVRALTLGA